LENLDSRLGGYWVHVIRDLFFKNILKGNLADFRNPKLILSLILRFSLRLGGYSIWSVTTRRTPYIKIFEDLKTTRAGAPRSLSTAREVLGGCM
jgi:hypothetical protein